jgi:hypothetical protein
MSRIPINTSTPNSGLGSTLRQAITDINTMMTELYTTVVFQEAGKALSSNDFTGPLQTKLNEIAAGAEVNVQADLLQADSTADSFIENKDALLPASPLSVMSGIAQGGLTTINTDTAKFNRAAGIAYIVDGHSNVDEPTVVRVTFAESLAISTPFLATNKETHVAVDVNGVNYFTVVPLSATERRNYARLGVLIHKDNATITRIDSNPTINIEAGGQIQDIIEAFGFRSLSGNRILPVGTNKKIKKELGRAFRSGANFKNLTTQPHSFILAAQEPITFNYITQTGVELATTTDIDPSIIDVNGTFTAMPSTATFASIQRVFIFQNGTVKIQPGQRSFVDLPTAINLINSGDFINDFDIENNALYLGAIAVTRNNANLSNTAEAIFVPSAGTSVNGSVSAPPLSYTAENAANKQNNLADDGTGQKYVTVDVVNSLLPQLLGEQTFGAGEKTFTDNVIFDSIVVSGTSQGQAATLSNQFVVKSQLDLKANSASPVFTGITRLAENALNTTLHRLRQVMGNSDSWEIYGEASDNDVGIMVFEVGDNGGPSETSGQKFEFRYSSNGGGGIDKKPLIIDYNKITSDASVTIKSSGNTLNKFVVKIEDLAGAGVRTMGVAADGTLVVNPFYPVFASNAAATTGGLQDGEFYRSSTGVLSVKF